MSIISSSAVADTGPLVPAKTGVAGAQTAAEAAQFAETHPASAEVEAPKYSSPKIYIDPRLHDVFYEFRDPQTGKQEYTIPTQPSQVYQNTQNQAQGPATPNTGNGAQTGNGQQQAGNAGQQVTEAAIASVGVQPAPAAPVQASAAPVSTPSVAPVAAPPSSGGGTSTLA